MLGELPEDGRPMDSAIPPGGILNQTIAGVTDILGRDLDGITVAWAVMACGADVLGSVRITRPHAFLDLLAKGGAAPISSAHWRRRSCSREERRPRRRLSGLMSGKSGWYGSDALVGVLRKYGRPDVLLCPDVDGKSTIADKTFRTSFYG